MPHDDLMNRWQKRLQQQAIQRQQQGLWRQPKVLPGTGLNFCSNDYLGLSHHSQLVEAYQAGLREYGCGSGGSPLISGYQAPHQQLSEKLADWLGREAVLLTGSGYAANYAVTSVFNQLDPMYYFDKRNHASMYDAVGYEWGADQRLRRFKHNDVAHLAQLLEAHPHRSDRQPVIASEGVFSMDGDELPLADLLQLKATHGARLDPAIWIDDAHGIGVNGEQGAGICGQTTAQQVAVVSATFGKAFAMGGAFIAGDRSFIEAAWQHARHYIYSTAFSAAQAHALCTAIDVIKSADVLRQQLRTNIAYFKQGLLSLGWRHQADNQGLNHAIQPVVAGSAHAAIALGEQLARRGIACLAIRPPTVPSAQAGVRVTLRANHQRSDIDQLLDALGPYQTFIRALPVSDGAS